MKDINHFDATKPGDRSCVDYVEVDSGNPDLEFKEAAMDRLREQCLPLPAFPVAFTTICQSLEMVPGTIPTNSELRRTLLSYMVLAAEGDITRTSLSEAIAVTAAAVLRMREGKLEERPLQEEDLLYEIYMHFFLERSTASELLESLGC